MERNLRKTRVGLVSSDKMDKTVVVSIQDRVAHPLYGKIVNRTVKYKAHDEKNECGVGDKVMIMEHSVPTAKTRDGVWLRSLKRLNNSNGLLGFHTDCLCSRN